MKKIQVKKNVLTLRDDSIIDFFEKEVTPHGTGGKIPCSSKYIGKSIRNHREMMICLKANEKKEKEK